MIKPWKVTAVTLTKEAKALGARAFYRYHVQGINDDAGGQSFSWTVPDLDDPRYDTSGLAIPALPA